MLRLHLYISGGPASCDWEPGDLHFGHLLREVFLWRESGTVANVLIPERHLPVQGLCRPLRVEAMERIMSASMLDFAFFDPCTLWYIQIFLVIFKLDLASLHHHFPLLLPIPLSPFPDPIYSLFCVFPPSRDTSSL